MPRRDSSFVRECVSRRAVYVQESLRRPVASAPTTQRDAVTGFEQMYPSSRHASWRERTSRIIAELTESLGVYDRGRFKIARDLQSDT
jgi:hypothetical protein